MELLLWNHSMEWCCCLFLKVLDQQKKGHLEPEELTKYLTQEGIVSPTRLLKIVVLDCRIGFRYFEINVQFSFVSQLNNTGEPFTQEEMDEMLSAAVDPDKNVILYKDFVSMMTFDDTR